MTVLLLRSISWCFALAVAFDQPNVFFRLLPKYGYFAVLIAAFLEGEATLIAAGVMCGAGLLDWRLTILAHERAAWAIKKSKRLSKWYPRIQKFVLRHATLAVLLSRFAAGFRISIPLVCATAGMPPKKYSTLNLVSGFAWASTWVAISYQIGAHV